MNYLIDTNVVSELVKQKPNLSVVDWVSAVPDDSLHLSVLTLGEIRKGIAKIDGVTKKEKLRMWLEHDLVNWFDQRILDIDAGVADRWGRLLAQSKKTIPAIDSLIAATALHFDLCLVTRNIMDFDFIPGLEIINPWQS